MMKTRYTTLLFLLSCMNASAFVPTDAAAQDKPVAQHIQLKKGWNRISFNVQDESMVSLQALKEAGTSYMASRSQALLYDEKTESWYGDLTSLDPRMGYSVKTEKDTTVVLSGIPYHTDSTQITIHKGWNWIGYLPQFTQYAAQAFWTYPATKGDRITDSDGKCVTYSTSWVGDFALQPGKGYHFYSSASGSCTLVYNTKSEEELKDSTHVGGADSEFIEIGDSTDHFDVKAALTDFEWSFTGSQYESDEMLCLKVLMDGEALSDLSGYTLSAWMDSECRGLSSFSGKAAGKAFFMLRAWGDKGRDSNRQLTFRLRDENAEKEYELKSLNDVLFTPDSVLGRPSDALALYAVSHPVSDLDITLNKGDNLEEMIFARTLNLQTVRHLKVSGYGEGIDKDALLKMPYLQSLDLSGARGFSLCSDDAPLSGLYRLQTLKLPTTVNTIPSGYFGDCESLKKVTLLSFTPPATGRWTFPYEMDTLYVNGFARPLYIKAGYSKYFATIIGLPADSVPRDIHIHGDHSLVYSKEMADAGFTPDLYIHGGLSLYGDVPLSLGHLSLYSGSSFLPLTDGTLESASMTVSAPEGKWVFFTPPFDTKVSDIEASGDCQWAVRKYDSKKRAGGSLGANWADVAWDDTLKSGEGYILAATGTADAYEFVMNATEPASVLAKGSRAVGVSDYRNTDSAEENWNWNFIANPYTSYFDIRYLDYHAPILVWKEKGYVAYSPIDDYYTLAPNEAFFIQTDGQQSVTFAQEGRCLKFSDTPDMLVKGSEATGIQRRVTDITLANSTEEDRTRVVSNPEAKEEYEIGRDMAKMLPEEALLQLYTIDSGIRYTIDERAETEGLKLGYRTKKSGTLSLRSDKEIRIKDLLTGITAELGGDKEYEFYSEEGTYEERFVICAPEATGIEDAEDATEGEGSYYNLAGQRTNTHSRGIVVTHRKKIMVK